MKAGNSAGAKGRQFGIMIKGEYAKSLNAHKALRRIDEIIVKERTQFVVEADIKGFFNNVSHEHMLKFIKHRITEQTSLLRQLHWHQLCLQN